MTLQGLARAIYVGRLREAWGQGWERRDVWPKDDKAWRAYPHNPIAEVDLALASAREAVRYIDGVNPCPIP